MVGSFQFFHHRSPISIQRLRTAPYQIVLWSRGRYTAQALQVDMKHASSSETPAAVGPNGAKTITDTTPHVTTTEMNQSDVTTTFVGSAVVEKSDPSATTFSSPAYVNAMTTEYLMTLKKALCRPVQLTTGNWLSSDAVGFVEFTGSLPELLLTQSIFAKKVDGFQGIRGSITLRLQATANPFQQGILKLQFYPMSDYDASLPSRQLDPASWSFWPSVELNLAKETACEFRVPFTIPVSFCDLVTTNPTLRPQMGSIWIRVYSQLKFGSGSTTVGWNLYGHWNEDDLELFNPTPNAYQSGAHHVSKKSVLPSDAEKKSSSISASLEVGAHMATIASGVPVLADVAGPTAWALRVASRVASAFGYSRPPLDSKPQMVVGYKYPYNSTVEGPDASLPLSLTIQPSLKVEPKLSGKTEDEMSIDSFVGKFGFNTNINMDTSASVGAVLLNYILGPYEHSTGELSYPKPHQMLALMFNYWRGNIRIRIKFAKTKMHTARLMFAFFPGVLTNQTLAQAEYVHREVVDIATTEELVYELPFTAPTPYLQCQGGGAYGAYGSFQIIVVNPLQAPSTVANNIDMIIETAMGEGSEWFSPAPLLDLLPVVPAGTEAKNPLAPPERRAPLVNQAQSGSAGVVKVSTLSDAKLTGHQVETSQLCVGEKLMSLRQLIKYPVNLAQSTNTVTLTTDASGSTVLAYYNPFVFGATSTTAGTGARTRDFLTLLGPYFRFNRGGMRVRGSLGPNFQLANGAGYMAAMCFPSKFTNTGISGGDTGNTFSFGGEIVESKEQIFKFSIPAWQTVPMVPNQYSLKATSPATALFLQSNAFYFRVVDLPPTTTSSIRLGRQPADDYELIGFVGPPRFLTYA